ncbi:MAG: hypothetical protein A2Y22_07095 [Clostridiales bacterium GWD2_32_59]|nr:MAG: hypothetical protein A2Y22_07095 [Clostridiales bacterium GWD2_32_59]
MDKIKRVACLYRVSTMAQVEENDIPMQKNACREFISKMEGWELYKEYLERGVSGYKNKSEDRDVLMEVKEAGRNKEFDVLLVFMFDRLGRLDNETPFVVKWFVDNGVAVWSVREGERRFDNHIDSLMNYITFWQASGESQKTSMRVTEKHHQMVAEGAFTGGTAPYGYKLEFSGVISNKGRALKKLMIDDEEAKIVKLIYDLALNYGMGGQRIAKYLNEKGIHTRKGNQWGLTVTNFMVRHPIYKGYMSYGKTTSKGKKQGRTSPKDWLLSKEKIEHLAIIPEDIWDKVQKVRNSRTPDKYRDENMDYSNYPMQTKSLLLFTGFIRCGCCGSSLSTGYTKNKWTTKDGISHDNSSGAYKCVGKTSGNIGCNGPFSYSKKKIEEAVLEEIFTYLDKLKKIDLTHKIEKLRKQNISEEEQSAKKVQRSMVECEKELTALKGEIAKSIMGKSSFKPDMLNIAIEEKSYQLEQFRQESEKLEKVLEAKKIEHDDMVKLQKMIPIWREEFENAPSEVKKVLLSQIIEEIVVSPNKIDIKLKMYINDFIKSAEDVDSAKVGSKRFSKNEDRVDMVKDGNLYEQNLCKSR